MSVNIPQIFADPALQGWAEYAIERYVEALGGLNEVTQVPDIAPSVAPQKVTDALTSAHAEINADPKWADLATTIRSQSYDEFVTTMNDYADSDALNDLINALSDALTWWQNSPFPSPDNIGHGEVKNALTEPVQSVVQQIAFNVDIEIFGVTIFVGVAKPIEVTATNKGVNIYIGVAGSIGAGEGADLIHYVGTSPLGIDDISGHSIGGEVLVGEGLGPDENESYAGSIGFNCTTNVERHIPEIYVDQWTVMSGNFSGEAAAIAGSIAYSIPIVTTQLPDIVLPPGYFYTVLWAITCYQKQDDATEHDEITITIQMDSGNPVVTYPYFGSHFSITELNEHSSDGTGDKNDDKSANWFVGMPLTFNEYAYVTLHQGNNTLGSMKVTSSMIPDHGESDTTFILDIPDDAVTDDIDYTFTFTSPV